MALTSMLMIQQLCVFKLVLKMLIPGEKIQLGDAKIPAQQALNIMIQEFV